MKKYRSVESAQDNTAENPQEDLCLINKYTKKELGADEVFTFKVMLCDNEADRDCERFAVESLFKLAELFVGKTGIYDHNPSAEKQLARIYKTWVEAEEGVFTPEGEQYFKLMAKAYIPVTEENQGIISRIESGILKEVSVGCAVEHTVCSVCGEESAFCPHSKGVEYDGKKCVGILIDPTDAYEWSFVAVPSQKNAGVVKSFYEGEIITNYSTKGLRSALEGCSLKSFEKEKLLAALDRLEKLADDGVKYRENLANEVKKYALLSKCGISGNTLDSIVKALDIGELRELKNVYEERAKAFLPISNTVPQSYVSEKEISGGNEDFKL